MRAGLIPPRPLRRYGLHHALVPRRLGFYVFATWVALTIKFLLPRLMPGDPIGGILQHLSPSQIQSNPGIIKTYQALLGGGHQSIWQAYIQYLRRVATLDFGISTSNYPTRCPRSWRARSRTRSSSSGSPSASRSSSARRSAWSPPGGAAAASTRCSCRSSWRSAHFRRTSPALVVVYFLGLKLGWFPIQHAYDSGARRASTGPSSRARSGTAAADFVVVIAFAGGWVLNMRTVMINTIDEDYVAMAHAKGSARPRVMTRYARATRSCRRSTASPRSSRRAVGGARLHRVRLQLPGRGLHAAAGGARATTTRSRRRCSSSSRSA